MLTRMGMVLGERTKSKSTGQRNHSASLDTKCNGHAKSLGNSAYLRPGRRLSGLTTEKETVGTTVNAVLSCSAPCCLPTGGEHGMRRQARLCMKFSLGSAHMLVPGRPVGSMGLFAK